MSATNKTLVFDPATAGESNVPRILGLGITFHALALLAFGLRMYTRAVIVRSFGKDDVLMILCMVCRPLCRIMQVVMADLVFLDRSYGRGPNYSFDRYSTWPRASCFYPLKRGPDGLREDGLRPGPSIHGH